MIEFLIYLTELLIAVAVIGGFWMLVRLGAGYLVARGWMLSARDQETRTRQYRIIHHIALGLAGLVLFYLVIGVLAGEVQLLPTQDLADWIKDTSLGLGVIIHVAWYLGGGAEDASPARSTGPVIRRRLFQLDPVAKCWLVVWLLYYGAWCVS